MINKVVLIVGGIEYGGWKSIQVSQSLDQMTGMCGFLSSDKFSGQTREWLIKMGDSCKVQVDGQTIIDGYIDSIPLSYDSESHDIQFIGRDRTADLIDCSFVNPNNADQNEWKGVPLISIITDLCSPFNIDVVADASASIDASAIKNKFNVAQGATVSEMIRDLCNMAGLLPISVGDGNLTLTRSGTNRTNDTLEAGINIKSASFNQDNKDRFSKYIVKGQGNQDSAINQFIGITEPAEEAEDNVITRYRPTVILPEEPIVEAEALKRARWEVSNRAGRSRTLSYTVVGWTQTNGDVWPLNGLVDVKDRVFGINQKYLISRIDFTIDSDSGTITTLTLVSPDTYNILTTPINKVRTGWDPQI